MIEPHVRICDASIARSGKDRIPKLLNKWVLRMNVFHGRRVDPIWTNGPSWCLSPTTIHEPGTMQRGTSTRVHGRGPKLRIIACRMGVQHTVLGRTSRNPYTIWQPCFLFLRVRLFFRGWSPGHSKSSGGKVIIQFGMSAWVLQMVL